MWEKARKKKESLCQTCFCFDCSWHEWFEPVEGWTATPTVVYNTRNNGLGKPTRYEPIKSYCVHSCPLYVDGNKNRNEPITLETIAKRIGLTPSNVGRRLRKGEKIVIDGKKVVSIKTGARHSYFLEKVQKN